MPLIPYPDVPPLPGVPGLNRSSAAYVAAALTVVAEFLPPDLFGPEWSITDQSGSWVLTPDSFVNFEYRNERKIPIYPIEEGSFQSYNKIAMPFDIRIVVSCNGNGKMTKQSFLSAIDGMLDSLDLFDISTPNQIYNDCNLIHVDYRRESRQGVSLILAQLWFQQVLISQQPAPPTTSPDGAANENVGQVSSYDPATGLPIKSGSIVTASPL